MDVWTREQIEAWVRLEGRWGPRPFLELIWGVDGAARWEEGRRYLVRRAPECAAPEEDARG